MRDRFTEALRDAMRAGDKRRVSTIRLIQAAIKDKDIEARGHNRGHATEDEIIAVLHKMVKQRQEAAEIFEKAKRHDLAKQEREEMAIVQSYLPAQMSEADTRAAIAAAVKESGAASAKDMGRVMAFLKQNYAGRMDMHMASGLVKQALSQG
jgi:uncharacterized protein YqeY